MILKQRTIPSNKRLQHLVLLSCVIAILVVGLGAYTRLSDAGLGCPDWPGCYGFLSVPTHVDDIKQIQTQFGDVAQTLFTPNKAWKEMIHRYFASTLGLLFVAILFLSFYRYIKNRRQEQLSSPLMLPSILVVLVVFQAFLGMLTVTMQLQPLIVMGHLLGGFALLSLASLLYLRLQYSPQKSALATPMDLFFCFSALLVLVIQISLGGWLAANYAAAACPSLPLCGETGSGLPGFSFASVFQLPQETGSYEYGVLSAQARLSIHLLHRAWAIFTAFFLIAVSVRQYLNSPVQKIKYSALMVVIAVLLQVSIGAILVYTQFPLSLALAHNLMAALLLLTLVRLTFYVHSGQRNAQQLSTQ